jgi:hypothetical protein
MDARTRKRFESLWLAGVPMPAIAEQLRYSVSTLARLRIVYQLPEKVLPPLRGVGGRPSRHEEIPSRAEILRRAAEVRQSWTTEQWMNAKVGLGHTIYDSSQRYRHE